MTDPLLIAAQKALRNSYVPYSRFPVACALLTADQTIITGVNVENASYGLTICAERVACFRAISQGHTRFRRVVIVTPITRRAKSFYGERSQTIVPCGACLQVLAEFADDLEIVCYQGWQKKSHFTLRTLLPHRFGWRKKRVQKSKNGVSTRNY